MERAIERRIQRHINFANTAARLSAKEMITDEVAYYAKVTMKGTARTEFMDRLFWCRGHMVPEWWREGEDLTISSWVDRINEDYEGDQDDRRANAYRDGCSEGTTPYRLVGGEPPTSGD